jgi:Spy/CpxP family protein refolding chaperone
MKRWLVILWAALVSAGAWSGPLEERLMSVLVSPERILQQAAKVQLSAEQEEQIRAEINRAQADILKLQGGLLESLEALVEQLRQTPLAEADALTRFEQLSHAEAAIKQLHFRTWLRVNALLTATQREQLRQR